MRPCGVASRVACAAGTSPPPRALGTAFPERKIPGVTAREQQIPIKFTHFGRTTPGRAFAEFDMITPPRYN